MRIHVLSDLHLNAGAYQVPTDLETDVVVVAGDVTDGTAGVEWLRSIERPVIFVPGNHEYYSSDAMIDMDAVEVELRNATHGTNIVLLQNDQTIVGGVRFLGTILWTDFGQLDRDLLEVASAMMTDYRLIRASNWFSIPENQSEYAKLHIRAFGERVDQDRAANEKAFAGLMEDVDRDATNAKFSPLVAYALHQRSVMWLSDRLNEPFDGKTVVVTHHHPSYQSLRIAGIQQELLDRANWKHCPDRDVAMQLNRVAAYASDLDHFLERHRDAIDLWICGHLHTKLDYVQCGVRVVCNPRGYGLRASTRSRESTPAQTREPFDPRFVVTV